jgi:hypothetical protein
LNREIQGGSKAVNNGSVAVSATDVRDWLNDISAKQRSPRTTGIYGRVALSSWSGAAA